MDGFPAAEKTLEDLRPLVAQLDPATGQLAPAVEFIGLYKRELTSFFANTVAATQAKDNNIHYLRTSNPLNPENLAVYPNRLPTNRPNPYTKPGHFDALQQGLPVYEDRQCNASNLIPTVTNVPLQLVNDVVDAVPTAIPIPPIVGGIVQLPPIGLPPLPQVPLTPEQAEALIPDALLAQIQQYAFGGGRAGSSRAACRKQGPFTFGGQTHAVPARERPRRGLARGRLGTGAASAGAGGGARPRAGRRGAGAVAAVADGVDGHAGGVGLRRGTGDRRGARALRRRRGLRARARRPGADGADLRSQPAARARGLPVGQRAARCFAAGGCGFAVRRLARAKPVRVVYGPGTFINSSVSEITAQLQARTRSRAAQADRAKEAARELALSQGRSRAEARRLGAQAEQLVYAQFANELLALNAKYGLNLTGAPKLNDPDFVYQLVFDPARGARVPKARFAYLFPSADSALISVRLKAGLSDDERARAVALVRAAVAMDEWRLDGGGRYVVTGVPVLAGDITDVLAASTLRLLLVAVAVMALVLALLFRARPRLLPLGLALCAAAIVFGGLAALGLPLTMASIAVLPVLMGLAVDYCVQFQARAASVASLATAALATCAGFAVLLLSPVPMVRGFGVLLVVGVARGARDRADRGDGGADLGGAPPGLGRRARALAAGRRRPRRRGARSRPPARPHASVEFHNHRW